MRTFRIGHMSVLIPIVLVATALVPGVLAQNNPAAGPDTAHLPSLGADQIVASLMAHNESRAAALAGYTSRRVYALHYRGFPSSRDAELIVEARFTAPATKEFTVISQSGSKMIVDKVLKRLLSSEEEAQTPEYRERTAMTPQNYSFELNGEEATDQGRYYILKVHPKTKNKYMMTGRIWVDAGDFAIARIEAEPAENPSFWISHTKIEQVYSKFGPFWLPVRNQSTSKIRIGGSATLVIEYEDYKLPGGAKPHMQTAMNETGKNF